MNGKNNNLIFISLLFVCLLSVFALNYFMLKDEMKSEPRYEIYHAETRDLVFIKLKLSKKYDFDKFVMGTSTTYSLFDPSRSELARLVVFTMTYREFYEYLKAYFQIHKETKTMFLPIEYHSFWDTVDVREIPDFDGKTTLSPSEFAQLYFSISSTTNNLKKLFEKAKGYFEKEKIANDDGIFQIETYPKRRITVGKVSEQRVRNDLRYWEQIIDFLQKNDINIVCYIPPYNYLYLQDAMTPQNEKIINDVKALIVSKGVKIYDFTKKNKFNEEPLKTTFMYHDLIHPDFIYGNIIYEILSGQKDDKTLYRLITKDNFKECNALSEKELQDYRQKYSAYIKEYFTYDNKDNAADRNYLRTTSSRDVPKELQKYL